MFPENATHNGATSDTEVDAPSAIQRASVDRPDFDNQPDGNEEAPCMASAPAEKDAFIEKKALWVPLSLRRSTLLLFAVLFIVLLAVLATTWRVSSAEQGLRTVNPNNYYLWTYGPTAVFTIVSALWGQVVYRSLQLFPWRLMSRGTVSASESVLLDYISLWNVSALVKSLKRRHAMVSVPIAVSLVIKVMTVISTGLFMTENVQLELEKEFKAQKVFDGNAFNQSGMDSRVYLKTWGVAQHNLSNPAGTTKGHALQNFFYDTGEEGTPIYLQNTTYQATVHVFTPLLECQEVSVKTYVDDVKVELWTGDCAAAMPGGFAIFPPLRTMLASCNGDTSKVGTDYSAVDVRDDVEDIDWRLWAYVAQPGTQHIVPDWTPSNSTQTASVDIIGLMCTLSYATNNGTVALTGTGDIDNPMIDLVVGEPVKPPGLVNSSASSVLYGAYLSVARFADGIGSRGVHYVLLGTDERGIKTLFNMSTITNRLTEMIEGLAVQLASEYFMAPSTSTSTSTLEGKMRSTETRLVLRVEAVYASLSILGLLALVSILFCLVFLPSAVCPRDPGSIGGLAAILTNSRDFMEALSGMGHASKAHLRKALTGYSYTTTTEEGIFSIKQERHEIIKSSQNSEPSWWRPFTTTPLARGLVLLLPICLIIALEILYQKSQKSNGLADVNTNTRYLSYTWTYIPPLVMLGVRTLYECVYFSARVFQPYHELKRGHAQAHRSILDNQHRKLAFVGVWDALVKRQWAVMAAGIAVLIGPSLPIAVSGLYTTPEVLATSNIALTEMNILNMSHGDFYQLPAKSEDVKLGDMILQYNLSYPQWTYKDLSLPKLAVNSNNVSAETAAELKANGQSIEARVPGLRLDMGCEEVPPEAFVAAIVPHSDGIEIRANVTALLEDCDFEPGGLFFRPDVPSANKYFSGFDTPRAEYPETLPSSCPGFVVMYGKTGARPNALEAITVLRCRPKLEQVDVSIRLSLPSYTFDLSSPPSVVPGSATTLYDGYMQLDELVAPDGHDVEYAILDIYPGNSSTEDLSLVFRSIIHGTAAIPASALLDAETLKDQLQRVWSYVTAQMINRFGRQDYDDPSANPDLDLAKEEKRPTHPATLITPSRTRLVQNMISTRILQGILAAMTVCGAVSIFLMDTREVLPKNPLSIAAAASLLADSRVLGFPSRQDTSGMISPGSEWCSNEQLLQCGAFQGRTFSLRWWPVTQENKSGTTSEEVQTDDVECSDIGVEGSDRGRTSIQSIQSDGDGPPRRFGIDVDEDIHV